MEKGMELPDLSQPATFPQTPQVYQPKSSLTPILLSVYDGVITYSLLMKSLAIDNWLNLQSPDIIGGWY